jgi:hypothetical protein
VISDAAPCAKSLRTSATSFDRRSGLFGDDAESYDERKPCGESAELADVVVRKVAGERFEDRRVHLTLNYCEAADCEP